jgi:hypothetical protein
VGQHRQKRSIHDKIGDPVMADPASPSAPQSAPPPASSAPSQPDLDRKLKELEVRQKEMVVTEQEATQLSWWRSRLGNPAVLAILAALAGWLGTLVTQYLSKAQERDRQDAAQKLEEQKQLATERLERQKLEGTLILDALKTGETPERASRAAANLLFLANAKLITLDPEAMKTLQVVAGNATPGLPSPVGHTPLGELSDDDTFKGVDRREPKTTIVTDAKIEEFATVTDLVNNILQKAPDKMMQEKSGITKQTMTRVDAEKRNVRVKGFIYAFKKEADNDYHVILGDAPGTNPPVFLTVEISGLPSGGTAENRKTLSQVRNDFKDALQIGETGPRAYQILRDDAGKPTPIHVQITGSLFWDVDHPPGVLGPGALKSKTSWEIHPVSKIEFLEQVP